MTRALVLCALAAAGCAGAGGGSDDAGVPDLLGATSDDSLPTGAIAFVTGVSCPAGWSEFSPALGRVVVPTPAGADGGAGGSTHGAPLLSGEDRKHSHAAASTVTLSDTSFVGVAGCCNTGPAAAGPAPLVGASSADSSGLPYVQLLICKKTSPLPPAPGAIPSGAMLFFDGDACPAGWTAPSITQGRHLVGLPDGGVPGATFGGPALLAGEERTHAHAIGGTLAVPASGVALASGCCGDGYGAAGNYALPAASDDGAAGLPYIHLLQCEKN